MSRIDKDLHKAKYGNNPVEYFKQFPGVQSVEVVHDEIKVSFESDPIQLFKPKSAGLDNGRDLYREAASRVFQIPYDDITKDQRTFAKDLLLHILYSRNANPKEILWGLDPVDRYFRGK